MRERRYVNRVMPTSEKTIAVRWGSRLCSVVRAVAEDGMRDSQRDVSAHEGDDALVRIPGNQSPGERKELDPRRQQEDRNEQKPRVRPRVGRLCGLCRWLARNARFSFVEIRPKSNAKVGVRFGGRSTVEFAGLSPAVGRHYMGTQFSRTVFAGLVALALSLAAARAADGDLDPAFGSGGKVVTNFDLPASSALRSRYRPTGRSSPRDSRSTSRPTSTSPPPATTRRETWIRASAPTAG